MFTEAEDLNPKVKASTMKLTLKFLDDLLGGDKANLAAWPARYPDLPIRFESDNSIPRP